MRFTVPLIVAAFVLLAADDPPKKDQEPKKDPQAAYEPRSGPGAGQKLLETFVGEWDVAKTFHSRSGTANKSSGQCRQTMIHNGRFLQSEFVFEQNGTKSTGLGLIGFEPATGTFTSVWTDSRQTRMSFRQSSKDPFDGKRIVLYSGSLEPDAKQSRRSKTISTLEDEGRMLIHRQYALGADGEERLVMELEMTRKPAPAGR